MGWIPLLSFFDNQTVRTIRAKYGLAVRITLAALVILPCAHADTFTNFILNVDGCSGGCGANGNGSTNNNFATIQLDDNGAGTVTVTETLHGTEFVNSSGKEAIAFVLPALTGLVITVADPTDFSVASGSSFSLPPVGTFNEAIKCTSCGSGGSHPQGGPLVFTVTASGGVTASDFLVNTNGNYFASDVIGIASGRTGDVAANGAGVEMATPEPATALLGLSSIVLVGFRLRRKTSGSR